MPKRLWVIWLLLGLTVTLCSCRYPTDDLVFLNEGEAVKAADIYHDIDAIVAKDGNCYIRGMNPASSFLYGVENTEQYLNLYKTLDVSKSGKFTQIYSGGDAENVRLSDNGGVIVTNASEVLLFADIEGYRTPTHFCADARHALLVEDRVYVLTTEGTFGYREVKTPDTFVPVTAHIRQFEIGGNGYSFWLLSDTDTLSVYTDEACEEALWQIEEVSNFDIWGGGADTDGTQHKSVFAYTAKGACYYYAGYDVENADKFANRLVDRGAVSAAVYEGGVMVLNEEKEVRIFGQGIGTNDTFNGEVIARDAAKLCGDWVDLAIVTEKGALIVAGTLPDSTSVSTLDLIEKASSITETATN